MEESKAELRQLEIELRKKAALEEKLGQKGRISLPLADLIAKYLREK